MSPKRRPNKVKTLRLFSKSSNSGKRSKPMALWSFKRLGFAALTIVLFMALSQLGLKFPGTAHANSVAQTLPFTQDWSNTGLITTDDDWSGVPGIVGFRGDGLTSATGVNPQTVLAESLVVDVNANQTNPNTFITGGVAEFGIANPTVALQGSGTARAPYIQFHLNTTGFENVNVAYNLRDIDGSADNAIQPVALQYRVGSSGNFTNVPAGFVADATTGPSLATLVTPVSVTLPSAVNDQPLVQVRVITTDAVGSDEWVGIDDIDITGNSIPTGVGSATPDSVFPSGTTLLTVAVTPASNPTSTAHTVTTDLTSIGGSASQQFFDDGSNGDVQAGDNVFSYNVTVANGTSGGAKSLPFTITETAPSNRTGSGSISLTVLAPTDPTGTGAANPNSVLPSENSVLTVTVTPGTNPPSTGIGVTADLSAIGGSASQQFFDDGSSGGDTVAGNNVFTYTATVSAGTTAGAKNLPFTISDAQARFGNGSIALTVQQPPQPVDHIVISQLYGGGGNTGAAYTNDYVELYNPTGVTFNLAGWSLQYASAAGTSWTNKQPIGGTIAPGEYFLVKLGSGGPTGNSLPEPNIEGDINMSASTGKLALVSNSINLSGTCPNGTDPDIVDFVGYGTNASCFEGAGRAPAPSNANAIFRKLNGAQDTNQNNQDFIAAPASPRRTAPIVELGPWVAGSEPITDGTNAPYDATVTIDFSEPVDVVGNWYDITCSVSGQHNNATTAAYNSFKGYHITPNTSFTFGEQCTVTIFHTQVHDQDLDDSNPGTDTLFADHTWTFSVVGAGAPAPYPPDVHLTMGNPSNAVTDLLQPDNYLMEKPSFALSYNGDRGTPNWVSWHLEQSWFGNLARNDTFRADPSVSPDWYRVQSTDYFASGFDRGHMTPNADRDNETRIPINQETYLMSNMVPQSPDNNQGPWASFENYLRSILPQNGEQEMYIVSGPLGVGGSGANGGTTYTLANGHITVPAYTWKVVLVIPKGESDITRVTGSTKTIAILMPNVQGIRDDPWENYITTVDAIEALTGYDFFSNVPDAIENAIEAGTNGVNPPGTEGQVVTTDEDTPKNITLTAVSGNSNPLTYTIVSAPTHGILSGADENRTYTPDPNFNGTDSFTFKVSDGLADSNTSTVNITIDAVNDAPVATDDSYVTNSNVPLNISASGVLGNDADIDSPSMTVVLVTDVSHGMLTLNSDGSFNYSPSEDFAGSDSFTYRAFDGTAYSGDTTVSITVNDTVAPVLTSGVAISLLTNTNSNLVNVGLAASASDNSGGQVTIQVSVFGDEDDQTATVNNTIHSPDAKDIALETLRLRGERVEANDGRVYLIILTATDPSGNVSHAYETVVVPKNNKQASIDSVNAQAAAAALYAQTHAGNPPPSYFVIGDAPIIGPKQ